MIEFIDAETREPLEFQYTVPERDAADYSAELYSMLAKRRASRHTASINGEIQMGLLLARAELLEDAHLSVHVHQFVSGILLPALVNIDARFREATIQNPDVAYSDVCDGYGVNADEFAAHAFEADRMLNLEHEIRLIG